MSIRLYNNSGGYIDLNSGGNGSTANTLTIPASAGTLMSSGNMPAFGAYASGSTSVSNTTYTKINFATERYDTNSNYASSRFTPTVAGYYLFSTNIRWGIFTATAATVALRKNADAYVAIGGGGVSSNYVWPSTSAIVYMNGSTDYMEVWAYQNSGSSQTPDTGEDYSFYGCLVRAA